MVDIRVLKVFSHCGVNRDVDIGLWCWESAVLLFLFLFQEEDPRYCIRHTILVEGIQAC